MIKHCVFLSLQPKVDLAILDTAMGLLSGLVGQVDGMLDFACGPNRDFEAKSPDFGYGFVTTFVDRRAHLAYEAHPDHLRAGAMLVSSCRNGHSGIFVADLETN